MTQVIEILAQQIGIPAKSLRDSYQVSMQWPEAKRRPDVCWTVHERLAYVRSRYILIKKNPYDPISKDNRWTVNEAEKIGRSVPGTPTTPEERLAKTRRLLHRDEDAADAVKEMLGPTHPPGRAASYAPPQSTDSSKTVHRTVHSSPSSRPVGVNTSASPQRESATA